MFIWILVMTKRYQSIQARYKRLLHGASTGNLESLLNKNHERYNELMQVNASLTARLDELAVKTGNCMQRIAVKRYNPFEDVGGDLSFSLALLDEHNTGIVITSIYAQRQAQVYAKSIVAGQSAQYRLTREEEEVIRTLSAR